MQLPIRTCKCSKKPRTSSIPSHGQVREQPDDSPHGYEKLFDEDSDRQAFDSNRLPNVAAPVNEINNPQEPILTRGLQIPSRSSYPTSGFKYPIVLEKAGMTKNEWLAFTNEITRYAKLSPSQWMTTVAGSFGTLVLSGVVISYFSIIPAVFVGHKMRKTREHTNLWVAEKDGALELCVNRWNESRFKQLGFLVRVDIPGRVDGMEDMDVSSSKLFKHQQRTGMPGNRKGLKYQGKEGRARFKAAQKGRIVIIPLALTENAEQLAPPLPRDAPVETEEVHGDRKGDLDFMAEEVTDQVPAYQAVEEKSILR